MDFIVRKGTEVKRDFLPKVMELDAIVYSEEYVGVLANMEKRYDENSNSFVCIIDEDKDKLAGYINFFPVVDELYEEIRYTGDVIRDDDISEDHTEVLPYSKEGNNIFIISIAIHPDYRGKEAVMLLTESWIDYLKEINEQYPINTITATAVSEDGMKFLRNRMFIQERVLTDGNIVYVCENAYLEKLLKNDLYHKSYKDDVYLMLPLAENKKNWRMEAIYNKDWDECGGIPDIPQALLDGISDCFEYECSNQMLADMETVYMGEYYLLHTTDDYETDGEAPVVGEELCYAIITAHKATHMFTLTLMIPNCQYSTTQVLDQLSYGFIKIRNPENDSDKRFVDIYDYLHDNYALFKAGEGKALLYMSGKPENDGEFQNILSGEVYNSMHIDYRIKSEILDEMCSKNYSQYNYYEVYLSDMVIAFIADKFSEDVFERIEVASTYSFIALLVMFQNTSLSKSNMKIVKALANDGDVSYDQILEIYQDFGKTVCFWEMDNYKYRGTQYEAMCIVEAFHNKKLKETHDAYKEHLEQIVEIKNAKDDARNGQILNAVATILALIQVDTFAVGLIERLFRFLQIDAAYADTTFITAIVCGSLTILLVYRILAKQKKHIRKRRMKID